MFETILIKNAHFILEHWKPCLALTMLISCILSNSTHSNWNSLSRIFISFSDYGGYLSSSSSQNTICNLHSWRCKFNWKLCLAMEFHLKCAYTTSRPLFIDKDNALWDRSRHRLWFLPSFLHQINAAMESQCLAENGNQKHLVSLSQWRYASDFDAIHTNAIFHRGTSAGDMSLFPLIFIWLQLKSKQGSQWSWKVQSVGILRCNRSLIE